MTFASQVGGTYNGMPVFDGQPGHLDAYLDTLMDYVGIEGAVRYAHGQRGDFTIVSGPNVGRVVPGGSRFAEGTQGVSTDFPTQSAMGQTWNQSLVGQIGTVIGDEGLYQDNFLSSISDFNPMISAALQDIRPNPLSGRLDEGFAEDPRFASDMIDQISRGISGIDESGNDQGFWTKAMIDTKHYTSYAAQWFRRPGSNDVSSRALMEYWSLPSHKSIESGAIGSMLTTYGRTNGIPNIVSPLITQAEHLSPWGADGGLYTTPDNGAERELYTDNAYSNGFDLRYTPSPDTATALMSIANAGSIAVNAGGVSPLNAALITQVQNGTYGVTTADVYRVAKTQVLPLVRMGLFNERDANGYPKFYPFLGKSAASTTPLDSTSPAHQQIALQSSQESLVLLKNDNNILPLSKSDKLAVVGPYSDTRFKTAYAVGNTPQLPNSGLTPVQGITSVFGPVSAANDGNVVALKSVVNGQYLTQGAGAAPALTANGADAASAATFEAFDWGQTAFSYRSTINNQWLQYAANAVNVGGTQALGTSSTTLPNRIRPQLNTDGTVSFVVDSYTESFGGGFETRYYTNGRYLTVDPTTNQVGVTAVFGNAANAAALNSPATKFAQETVRQTGSQAVKFRDENGAQYAVVVVGAAARNSSGEGADRSDLHLGASQYQLVENVANTYPGKTIVVISSATPVIAADIQANPKIAGIVYAPYNGQYGNYALGQLLGGDFAPSGRLTQSWYASMDALPKLTQSSIPEGRNATVSLDGLDPRFTVDMTSADPVETKLTYMYTDAPTTYEFGYGLSYTQFKYKNLTVQPAGPSSYKATVDVKNTGNVASPEVVQLYAANPKAAYGTAAPKESLVAFNKVTIPAGTTKTVTLTFGADKLALWDTNTNQLAVEAGQYSFMAGGSSKDLQVKAKIAVPGVAFGATDAFTAPINVFDHSFDASDVTYREASKQNTVTGLRNDSIVNGYYAVMSRAAGSWTALNDVNFSGADTISLAVAAKAASSVDVRLDSPAGPTVAHVSADATGPTQYVIPGTTPAGDIPVSETAYTTKTVDLTQKVKGTHDVYLVFAAPDVRVLTAQLGVAVPPALVNLAKPTVDNASPRVGDVLTATPGSWQPAPTSTKYQWLRDGQPITGGIQRTYRVAQADAGHQLSVSVSAALKGYTTTTVASESTALVKSPFAYVGEVYTSTNAPKVGLLVSAVLSGNVPQGASVTYQWLLDGQPVAGGTAAGYKPIVGDIGHLLSVTATVGAAGYETSVVASAQTKQVKR
ncbi:glycoside hydrolase family 3 C-terminal domain-containing protein [Cellulomonas sp. McL0617]|uniref:glycoside hydrolase family 3 protein n=1 Tax=Cellulomonas sp. McL0617 TaxID=3415675 RepID=UPI003CF22B11